jgi:excisionase family DNA binding protein
MIFTPPLFTFIMYEAGLFIFTTHFGGFSMDKLLSPNEARGLLRCSLARLYALSSQGEIAKYKIGGRLFFKERDVRAYLESCRIEARRPDVGI